MIIFDSFPSEVDARRFAETVKEKYKLKTFYDVSHDDSGYLVACVEQQAEQAEYGFRLYSDSPDALDVFPFQLIPPIVCVARHEEEDAVEALVAQFGGRYAGT